MQQHKFDQKWPLLLIMIIQPTVFYMCLPEVITQLAFEYTLPSACCSAECTVGSMRIIPGSAAGRHLVSPPGEGTRPMMEKVRGAVFSMVASMAGSQPLVATWQQSFLNPQCSSHLHAVQVWAVGRLCPLPRSYFRAFGENSPGHAPWHSGHSFPGNQHHLCMLLSCSSSVKAQKVS